jgi:indolepyruvate ferredoxin oxidoreductase
MLSRNLEELVARREQDLKSYQNEAYAQRYTNLVERVRQAETATVQGSSDLTEAVARGYYKLLAYKDEYEVARLYSDPEYLKRLQSAFEGDVKLTFHLAPPILARRDAVTGKTRKMAFGPWMLVAFRYLAKLKGLRGTPFDVFGYTEDRKLERKLLADYERLVDELIGGLDRRNHKTAVALAALPEQMRGFGDVKHRHVAHAKKREAELLRTFRAKRDSGPSQAGSVEHSAVIMAG